MPTVRRHSDFRCILALLLGVLCGCQSGPWSQLLSRGEQEPVIEDAGGRSVAQLDPEKASEKSSERKRPRSLADRLQKPKPTTPETPDLAPKDDSSDRATHKSGQRPAAIAQDDSQPAPAEDQFEPTQSPSDIALASGESTDRDSGIEPAVPAQPISKTQLDQPTGDDQFTNGKAAESDNGERWSMEAMKILPGKRDGKTLSERLTGTKLTPPWNREGASTPPPYKRPTEKIPLPTTAPEIPAAVEPVRNNPKADFWEDELHKVISLMEAEAARPPADNSPAEKQAHIQRQVYLRMLYLMVAEPEKAQLPLTSVDPVDQEFWSSMFWGMSNYFTDDPTIDVGSRAAQTIAQLQTAARHLQALAELEIRNANFCQRIDGWGNYDRFDRDEFDKGQSVLVYAELRNFHSEQTATEYRTLVHSTIEIVRAGAEEAVLERFDMGQVEDLCRGLRTDFYNNYQLTIPANLLPGAYRLRLIVEDQLSGKIATQTLNFIVR